MYLVYFFINELDTYLLLHSISKILNAAKNALLRAMRFYHIFQYSYSEIPVT